MLTNVWPSTITRWPENPKPPPKPTAMSTPSSAVWNTRLPGLTQVAAFGRDGCLAAQLVPFDPVARLAQLHGRGVDGLFRRSSSADEGARVSRSAGTSGRSV